MSIWSILGLSILVGLMILVSVWLFSDPDDSDSYAVEGGGRSPGTPMSLGNVSNAFNQPGLQPAAVKISAKECRNKCRSQCGGARPIARLTKKQKAKGACWDNCRGNNCGWVPFDQLND